MYPVSDSAVMLATLGGQPQVITFALDELLARGAAIEEVIVLYLSAEGSRVNRALAQLSAEFVNDRYRERPCRLRPMPIRRGLERLADIQTDQEAIATSEMLRDLIIELKQEQRQLHVFLGGGRRMMALLLVPLAMLYFGYQDRLWHIYTPDEVQALARDGAMMHAQAEHGVRLLQVPLIPLGAQLPAWQELVQTVPNQARLSPAAWRDETTRIRCQAVVDNLTPRLLEVLQAFAAGLSPQQVANELGISLNTVNTHKKQIFDLCRNAWPEQERLRYPQLREWFGPYFENPGSNRIP